MSDTPSISSSASRPRQSFAYIAQAMDGRPMNGTIEASDIEDAARQLNSLHLRIVQIQPASGSIKPRPLTGAEFAAFNQQLANLAAAGLPVEYGLRLIAEDLSHGGLAQSIRGVANELEHGAQLGEAFDRHRSQFPPLYGLLVDAGVRAGNLPEVLLNLGRHLELISRLRTAIWQSAAYPMMVLAGLLIVMIFIAECVIPQFTAMYRTWVMQLPSITVFVFGLARFAPVFVAVGVLLFVGTPLIWLILRVMHLDRRAADLLMNIPLIGSILRQNLVARWCDAMKLGIQANMDLPAALEMSSDIVGSPAVRHDSMLMVQHLQAGQSLDRMPSRFSVLPTPVMSVLQFASERNDLPNAFETLSRMYEQQAEMRLAALQTILTPLLLAVVAALVAITIFGLFAPIVSLFRAVG